MGDNLGDDWEAYGVDLGDEETAAAIAVQPKAMRKTGKKEATTKPAKNKSKDIGDGVGKLSGRKRGREQLSPEGFEESQEEEDGVVANSDEGDEEARRAEEAKRARAEKKKQKLKALKVKLKAKKQGEKEQADSAAATQGGGERDGGVGETGNRGEVEVKGVSAEAAHMWARYCAVRGSLITPLELENPWITAGSLAHIDGFGSHTLAKLAGFIKASLPDWKKKIQNRNSNAPRAAPAVLIVCSGARRCVEVMKYLTAFRCQVVKLFAKHLKVEEQKAMLRKGCFPLAVGTPGRMRALADVGALALDAASLLVLDMEKNIKGRDVLTMDGVASDTMRLLAEYARPNLLLSEPGGSKDHAGSRGKGNVGQLRIALY